MTDEKELIVPMFGYLFAANSAAAPSFLGTGDGYRGLGPHSDWQYKHPWQTDNQAFLLGLGYGCIKFCKDLQIDSAGFNQICGPGMLGNYRIQSGRPLAVFGTVSFSEVVVGDMDESNTHKPA